MILIRSVSDYVDIRKLSRSILKGFLYKNHKERWTYQVEK
jgi:hypothetical protein